MKLKTSELTGPALDWAVAKCNGKTLHYFVDDPLKKDPWLLVNWDVDQPLHSYTPSTDWAQGGPIIEREKIEMAYRVGVHWIATRVEGSAICEVTGPTQLVAAMRCYVKAQLGDEVDVPDELV